VNFKSFLFGLKSDRDKEIRSLLIKSFKVRPKNLQLYRQAVCHKSAARNIHNDRSLSNERLEFLGDAVIDATIADYLYRNHPNAEEGEMTKMKSRIVSRANLNATAVRIGLHTLIETDLQATNSRQSISGNAFEAVVGAIYLDKGYDFAKRATLFVLKQFSNIGSLKNTESDFKSRIYEEAHKRDSKVYFKTNQVSSESGSHLFSSCVLWNGDQIGQGKGSSKKRAEQQAASEALKKISKEAD